MFFLFLLKFMKAIQPYIFDIHHTHTVSNEISKREVIMLYKKGSFLNK